MASFIKVEEQHYQNYNYLCGTIFLRKNELDSFNELNVYDAFFIDKGRRFSQYVESVKEDCEEISPKVVTNVAAKLATMKKISKKDKKLVIDNSSSIALGIYFAFLCSIIFGITMTIGFMVIELIIVALFIWMNPDIYSLYIDTPWNLILLGTSIPLFIIIVSLFFVFCNKKR